MITITIEMKLGNNYKYMIHRQVKDMKLCEATAPIKIKEHNNIKATKTTVNL